MFQSESVQETGMDKILRDFDEQMDHLISPRRPDLVIIKKKELVYWILPFQITKGWK